MIGTLLFWGFFIFMASMIYRVLKGLYFLVRYRDEYRACLDAAASESEEAVDQVNRWSRHYYVHKFFTASSSRQHGLRVRYVYAVRERSRDPLGGGGGSDMIISF